MQPRLAAPRDHLTSPVDVVAIVESDDLEVDAGLDLVDSTGQKMQDISEVLQPEGSHVERDATRGIHGTCQLQIAVALNWGADRVRPWMTLTSRQHGQTIRANLGHYLLTTPERTTKGSDPSDPGVSRNLYVVEGYDLLEVLNTPIGRTYRAAAGAKYLEVAKDLLLEYEPDARVLVDPAAADLELPAARTWGMEETGLAIVNGLLSAVGYRGVWNDWNGAFRFDRWRPLAQRPPEWTYDTTSPTSIVGEERAEIADYFDVPNVWVFIVNRPAIGVASGTDGSNGRLVVENIDDGPTSIAGRGGLIRRRVVTLDAADGASLAEQANRIVAADRQLVTRRTLAVGCNPLHWHLDVVTLRDDTLGSGKFLVPAWTLPLDGSDMLLQVEA